MEPEKIDWSTIESEFETDDTYEHINAPQWIDFLASPPPHAPHNFVDDESWFCRQDCKHPKTAEDFLKSTPTSKLSRSAKVTKFIGLGDWKWRDGNLKRRGQAQPDEEDCENQNPNLSTPLCQSKSMKTGQDEDFTEIPLWSAEKPRLKSTLSASDLFGGTGRGMLSKITEFCKELKRMAGKGEQESGGGRDDVITESGKRVVEIKNQDNIHQPAKLEDEKAKEGMPMLLEVVSKEKSDAEKVKERMPLLVDVSSGGGNGKTRKKKRVDDAENIIPLPMDLKNVRGGDEKRLLGIRTSPPTPQCFSATQEDRANTAPRPKAPKSRLMMDKDREILVEVVKQNEAYEEELEENKSNARRNRSLLFDAAGRGEGRTLDVFCFLKPCTLSTT